MSNAVKCTCGKEGCPGVIWVDESSGNANYIGMESGGGISGIYLDANGIKELIRILKEALLE